MDWRGVVSKTIPWVLIFFGVPLLLYATGIGCPIKFVTGVSCPGCGMTRAWLEALSLHFDRALAYHPLFWMLPVAVVIALLHGRLPRRLYMAVVITFLVLLLLVWLFRMLLPEQWDVVVSNIGAVHTERVVSVDTPRWVEWILR